MKKKRKIVLGIIAVLFVIGISIMVIAPSVVPNGEYCERVFDNSGSESDPLEIDNGRQLECYSNQPNSSAVLTSDINLTKNSSQRIFPIGIEKNESKIPAVVGADQYNPYVGSLNGQNHTIRNVYLNETSMLATNNGTIKNIIIKNATTNQNDSTYQNEFGIVTGTNSGSIKNVDVEGDILIKERFNESRFGGQIVGGITGKNYGTIVDAESNVNIDLPQSNDVGGIAGWNYGSINKSVVTGDIHGKDIVGGVVGTNQYGSLVYQSYATGNVTGNWSVGGLVGNNDEYIVESYYTGYTNGYRNVGGLSGSNEGTIYNSYTTGGVNGSIQVGGIVGEHQGTIENSYITGQVTGTENVGPVTGFGGNTGENVYWNIDSTGIVPSDTNVDIGSESVYVASNEGSPLQTNQMTGRDAIDNMSGFDFGSTWTTVSRDYPNLSWQK